MTDESKPLLSGATAPILPSPSFSDRRSHPSRPSDLSRAAVGREADLRLGAVQEEDEEDRAVSEFRVRVVGAADAEEGPRVITRVDELERLPYTRDYRDTAHPLWIDVQNCTQQALEILAAKFRLHPLTVEDCTFTGGLPEKVELFDDYLVVAFHALRHKGVEPGTKHQQFQLSVAPIAMVVFPSLILTVHTGTVSSLNLFTTRLAEERQPLKNTAWLLHGILDALADSHSPVVEATCGEVDTLEDLIYLLSGSEHRGVLKCLRAKSGVIKALLQQDLKSYLTMGLQLPYFRDVEDNLRAMLARLEVAADQLSTLQSTYLADVSIEIAESSQAANLAMKNMSAVATLVLPLSLLASIFGMNLRVPFQFRDDEGRWEVVPFLAVLGLMAAVMLMMGRYLRNRGLLG